MKKLGIIFIFLIFQACSGSSEVATGSPPPGNPNPNTNGPQSPDSDNLEPGNLPPPLFPEQAAPALSESFLATPSQWKANKLLSDESISFGLTESTAVDSKIARLTFPGHPEYGPPDKVGPGKAVSLESSEPFQFGTFRIRTRLSACAQNNEGGIYGLFTYWNNGTDLNKNGLIDNSEIDIEISCTEAAVLYLTIWTDYTNDNQFLKVTRKIDLQTGLFRETKVGQENQWGLNQKGPMGFQISDFSSLNHWLDIGWTWSSSKIEFFLYRAGERHTLWTYQNADHIPTHEAPFLMNIWHSAEQWSNDEPADFPSQSISMDLDQFSYFTN